MNNPPYRRLAMATIRVLIVDDSAFVRKALSVFFKAEGLEVVGVASNPYEARDLIVKLQPDILTLDLEMPRMDGLTFLDRLMTHRPMPVVIFSSFTDKNSALALKALELGAVEVLEKPTSGNFGPLMIRLVRVLKETAMAKPRRKRLVLVPQSKTDGSGKPSRVIGAIGASTGGTDALSEVLRGLPADHPGLVLVQHMPAFFTADFAARLDRGSAMKVREAKSGDVIQDGLVLVARGDRHMVVDRDGGKFRVNCPIGPMVNHCRPSVDVLFHSVARSAGPNAVGVILTGMGHDGAGGLLAMREAGAVTLAQDEATSVVYGMPKEARARGAVDEVVPLHLMADALQAKIRGVVERLDGRTQW